MLMISLRQAQSHPIFPDNVTAQIARVVSIRKRRLARVRAASAAQCHNARANNRRIASQRPPGLCPVVLWELQGNLFCVQLQPVEKNSQAGSSDNTKAKPNASCSMHSYQGIAANDGKIYV